MAVHCEKDCIEERNVQHQEECRGQVELGGLHKTDLSVLSWRMKQFCTWREDRRTPGADRLSCAKMGRCGRSSEKPWVDEVWGAPRRGEAGEADWGQVRECLARLPWEFIFHLVSREETTQGFQPESECFVIKICTLKKINQRPRGRDWMEKRITH